MPTRTSRAFARLRYVLPLCITGCAAPWLSAQAADLPLRPVPHAAAPASATRAADSRPAQVANPISNAIEAIGTRIAAITHPSLTASDRASAARARFDDARAAMDRAILLRADDSVASVAAVDAAMKDVSENLALIEHMPQAQPADSARTTLNLVEAWYNDGMKIVRPPQQGLLEVPLPMNVRRKADAVASALDKLVEQVAAPARQQTIASARDRASAVVRAPSAVSRSSN